MEQTYIITDNALQEEILSKEINLKSWRELADKTRAKATRLTTMADAFERYDREGEPFIGESLKKGAV